MKFFTRDGKEVKEHFDTDLEKGVAKYYSLPSCYRCGGRGGSDAWLATGWTCFTCGGIGHLGERIAKCYTGEKLDKLNASREKRRAAAERKAEALRQEQEEIFQRNRDSNIQQFEESHPGLHETLVRLNGGNTNSWEFLPSIIKQIEDCGELSNNQMEAVEKCIESNRRYKAELERRGNSQHVGEVGERRLFELTCNKILNFGAYCYGAPITYCYLCTDADGNTVKYVGNAAFMAEGDTEVVKGTVKEHGEYKGEKQTQIARPVIIEN